MCLIVRTENGFDHMDDELIEYVYNRNRDGFGYMYHDDEKGLVTDKGLYTLKEVKRLIRFELPNDRPVYIHFRKATSGSISSSLAHPYKIGENLAMLHNGVMSSFEPKQNLSSTKRKNNITDSQGKTQPSSSGNKAKKDKSSGSAGPSADAVPTKQNPNDTKKADSSSVPATNSKSNSKNKKKGNSNPSKKNDTVNFVRQYLEPALLVDPYIYLDSYFIDKTESVIGFNNKLVFMDGEGNEAIYNKEQWVEYAGMMFSNTYTWPYYQRKYHSDNEEKRNFTEPDGRERSWREIVLEEEGADIAHPADIYGGGWYDGMPSTISGLEDLQDMTWEQIYAVVSHEPDEIASILYYEVLGHDIFTR